MTDKFTIRDILVYSIVGLTSLITYFIHHLDTLKTYVVETKDYSDLTILLLIPVSYLIGQIIFGIDNIIFNNLLFRPLRDKSLQISKWYWKLYITILFGNRNLGVRKTQKIDDDNFLETCSNLLRESKYSKAEYYQILSDLFKGLYLITIYGIIYIVFRFYNIFETNGWKCFPLMILLLHFVFFIIIWYRGRIFSTYYVNYIKREIKHISD